MSRPRHLPRALLLTSVLALMVAVASLGRAGGRAAPVPRELRGTWNPVPPGIAQHPFRFDSAALHLNISSGAEAGGQVVRIDSRSLGDTTYYTVEYHSDGRRGLLNFGYSATPVPTIRATGEHNRTWSRVP